MFHVTNEILGSWLHAIYVQHTVNINNIEHSTAAAELGQQFDFAQHRVYDPFTLFLYKQCANGFFFLFLFAPILACSRLALCLMSIMEKKNCENIQSSMHVRKWERENCACEWENFSRSRTRKLNVKMWAHARIEQKAIRSTANGFFIVSSTATVPE